MEILSQYLNQGLEYAIPIIVLLGLLVFVHELGHFLAARFFGVRVETFSLGFGPQILKYVKGHTTYCISAIPLGGYVKMFGDIYGDNIPEEEKPFSYLHKPVFQRIVIAFAGPLMNLLFAALLFWQIAIIGTELPNNRVGHVFKNSPAYTIGLRSGDEIAKANGKPIQFWNELQDILDEAQGNNIQLDVLRGGKPLSILAPVVSEKNPNSLSSVEKVGQIEGLSNQAHYTYVGVKANSTLYKLGLRSGDRVTHVDGQEVRYYQEIFDRISREATDSKPVTLSFERTEDFFSKDQKKEKKTITLNRPIDERSLGLFIPETLIVSVKEDSPAARAGLQVGDRLASINDHSILSFTDIVKSISGYKKGDPPLQITFYREGKVESLDMIPLPTDLEDQFGVKENRPTIGIVPLVSKGPVMSLWRAPTFGDSLVYGIKKTREWTGMIFTGLIHMFTGKVATKNIGGIFSIGAAASYSWAQGLSDFLRMMAIISINLFILNLLPVPVLDGGHLVLFFLEALKGAPLSLRKVELANQIGFLLVLFLMAFALFNDLSRLLGSPS